MRDSSSRTRLYAGGAGVIALALFGAFGPTNAGMVERWFSSGVYVYVQPAVTAATNLVPVALLDVAAICAAIWLVRLWIRALRSSPVEGRIPRAARAGFTMIAVAAAVYVAFLGLWGLNYRRVPLESQLVLDKPAPGTEAVIALGTKATQTLNELAAEAHRAGWAEPVWESPRLRQAAADVQARLGRPRTAQPGRLKATMFGQLFRWNGVDGMINPLGLEVLANPDLLPFERPFVAAHEWAHLAGYADEAEANFVGWLTCLRADVPAQYSGWLFLYWQVTGELGAAERASVDRLLDAAPRRDLDAIVERLRRGDLPLLRRMSWAAYDQYLKANRVDEGVRSYGAVLTLILRARFEDGWVPVRRASAPSR